MSPNLTTTLDHLLDTPTCQHCGQPRGSSVSDDFCSETCQHTWHTQQATPPLPDQGGGPDESLPEATPAQPLTWLHPPSATATARTGHEILDELTAFITRFSVFPSEHCAPTLALWYAHTHAAEQFYVTPRLVLDSAEPGSGKTRVLEVAQYLVRAPEMTISATPAALFRLVSLGPITILFDEVDAIFNPKNGGNHEDLRGLLNAGYKRSATIARCVGDAKNIKVERFPVYAPAALAGIAGAMPSTITTRAITIHMRRRRPDEPVEPFRERHVARDARPLRDHLTTWIDSVRPQLSGVLPTMPEGVTDRPAEIWEPLLALAETAGGHWPTTAHRACRHFVLDAGPVMTSDGIRLLADLRDVFTQAGTGRLRTTDILTTLTSLDEAPWGDLEGKPLDARHLARLLDRYGVKPKNLKLPNGAVVKGYRIDGDDGLADAWSRYLPSAATTATTATTATAQVRGVADTIPVAEASATTRGDQVAAPVAVADLQPVAATPLTCTVAAVAAVADEPRHPTPVGGIQ
ncbi:MAG: DUF3631 domain-containing protein [Pseudonocardiales bacterium]|nr:DUF3631 domain-containing protein [Pseudonocardiales bacterium]